NGNLVKTGYDLAKWIVDSDLDNTFKLPSNFKYKVHSQNPVGKKNIIALLDGYLKFKNTSKSTDDSKSLLSHYLANMSNTYD
ncbi:MAG: cyclic-phosphate processing receiver domain-containing protein, partial [Campylobacterota bacterium]|nr:cyclic-phosphate processing receiver domain-containing protein [Campylobacterota bacterium]